MEPDYSTAADDFCFSSAKRRITSFGEQDEIGLNRFPCLASYRSFQFLQQQVLEVSTSQKRPFQSYLCGAGPAPDIPSLQLLAVLSNSRLLRHCTESPIPKEKVWSLHEGWDLFRAPNLSPTVPCLQASKCSLSPSQPCRYAMEGSATMLTLPRVLPAWLPGVGKDTETQGSLTEPA